MLAAALTLALPSPWSAAAEADADAVARNRQEYDEVARQMSLSKERLASLAAEVATIKRDSASITAALIQSAKTEKKLSGDIEEISGRLDVLKSQQQTVRESLSERRGVLAEVLGALERMGLNPPPAILVAPEDALSSVRSSILLGAVVPELRGQAEALLADMRELQRLATSVAAERDRLQQTVSAQLAEKQRLSLLLDMKKKLQQDTEADIAAEQRRSEELAARAGSLKELIAGLQAEAEARKAAQERQDEAARRPVPEKNRLAAPQPFETLKARLALPVPGAVHKRFGDKDGNGGVMQGDMVATQSGAIVTAPANAGVLYAGPFRSYGQLLILDAGGGYHIVLAGMSRISVATGRQVLSGEPVGVMGEARLASLSAPTTLGEGPELYVEFRKDGKPVDPASWWTRNSGRTGNGA